MTQNNKIFKIVMAGALIAIGWVLPFATGQIKEIGNMLSPMHLPVYIGAFLLGPWYGMVIGLIIPITRSLIFSMPVLFPNAVCMSIELGTYGLVSGLMFNYVFKNFRKDKKQLLVATILSLLVAMVVGRVVWGLARMACLLIPNSKFTFAMFMNGAILTAWPGIIIQLILIPTLVLSLNRKFIVDEDKKKEIIEEETK